MWISNRISINNVPTDQEYLENGSLQSDNRLHPKPRNIKMYQALKRPQAPDISPVLGMLADFRLARYRFVLETTSPISLPPYKGSAFRGVFGHALKRVVCVVRDTHCETCLLQSQCLYPNMFETRFLRSSSICGGSRKGQDIPRPFILVPPLSSQPDYEVGDALEIEFTLIGRKTIEALPYLVATVEQMGRLGVGRKMGVGRVRGKFRLHRVLRIDSTGVAREIYAGQGATLADSGPATTGQELASQFDVGEVQRITLEFLTNVRLQSEEQRAAAPEFSVFFGSLFRRLMSLARSQSETGLYQELKSEYQQLMDKAGKVSITEDRALWKDWERYSNRQRQRMKLGGFLGVVMYEGGLTPFLPYLMLGEWVHAGKGATFGLGKYRVHWNI